MATGQEGNTAQIFDLLIKYGSLIVNLILGLIIYIYNRELKSQDKLFESYKKEILKELQDKDKDIEVIRAEAVRNDEEVHQSFQDISANLKGERIFWQEFYNKIKDSIDNLYIIANGNIKDIQSIKIQIQSELKRIDEKIQSLKDMLIYKTNGNKNANKDS